MKRLNEERCAAFDKKPPVHKWLVSYSDYTDSKHPVERTVVLANAAELSEYLLKELKTFDSGDSPISAVVINRIQVESAED